MPKQKRRGRPKTKAPDDVRELRLSVAVSKNELEKITNSTGKLDVSDSAFVRGATLYLIEQLERGELEADEVVELLDKAES